MTQKELSEYLDLAEEIKEYKESIRKKTAEYEATFKGIPPVYDSVVGSSTEYPFCLHTVTIQGVPEKSNGVRNSIRKELSKTISDLWTACEKRERQLQRINKFIESVSNSKIRRILKMRYVCGNSFQKIASKLGYQDEGSPRKKLEEFFKHSENSE